MMVRHRPFRIDPWTPTPQWNGQPLDLAWAIAVLRPGWHLLADACGLAGGGGAR